jgi:Domain of unknown function (DUF3846)
MSRTVSTKRMEAPPLQALIINPDNTFEVREIGQDLRTFQSIVSGYLEDIPTEHCVFWRDEESMLKDAPTNDLATYLWWKLCPTMEGKAVCQGTVFITGSAEGEWCEPVPDAVVELFERIEGICREVEQAS